MSPLHSLIQLGGRAALLLIASGASAGTLYVPTGYPTIQAAIDAATDGDTVLVADGVYAGPGNRDLDFTGRAITVRSENGGVNCIIDCQAAGRAFHFHTGETAAAARVAGFTIRGGRAVSGGAILCELGSAPTITDCEFTGNHTTATDDSGGALACDASTLAVVRCVFRANTTAGFGGAVALANGAVAEFTDCRFEDNTADVGSGALDAFSQCHLTLTRCAFLGNEAHGTQIGGGGAFTVEDYSRADVRECEFIGNSTPGGGGGLVCVDDSELHVTDSTFRNNIAGIGAGAVAIARNTNGIAHLIDCRFLGNSAQLRGGAIVARDSGATFLANCSFVGNTADEGGAIRSASSNLVAVNCTFSGNVASVGGAISASGSFLNPPSPSPSVTTLSNCIFWDDDAGNGAEMALQLYTGSPLPPILSVDYCDVQDGQPGVYVEAGTSLDWGAGNLESDPFFVDPASGDFRLGDNSPCIDTGDPLFAPQPCEHDLDHACRVWDGDADAIARVDMGASEFAAALGDLDGDCQTGLTDLATLLAHFGTAIGATHADGDLNADGTVDLSDLSLLLASFGRTCP